MYNELILLIHCIIVSASTLIALRIGKSALIALISIQCILANLFVIKQTTLFGFSATCSDAFTIGATISLNLLQEYFGKTPAKKAIWINFFLLIFYVIMSQLHLLYIPNQNDISQASFLNILECMPRIVIASFSVYFFVQTLDYYLYGLLKHACKGNYLVARNYFSLLFCQLVDTILFSFLGLYGIVNNVWHIIAVSYAIKILSIFIVTPFIALSKSIVQKNIATQ